MLVSQLNVQALAVEVIINFLRMILMMMIKYTMLISQLNVQALAALANFLFKTFRRYFHHCHDHNHQCHLSGWPRGRTGE